MARIYSQAVFVGDIFPTNHSGPITILEYTHSKQVLVRFEDGRTKTVSTGNISKGEVGNEYATTVEGVGHVGLGDFSPYHSKYKTTKEYSTWKGMLRRCYSEDSFKRCPTYEVCTVCDNWLNFQEFAKWYANQEVKGDDWQLDKDLTVIGNKIYSPQTCAMIPREVNNILVSSKAKRGPYPLGVTWYERDKKFVARVSKGDGVEVLGSFLNTTDAFMAYKFEKESYIKVVANRHKDVISESIYTNLMKHEISITD